MHKLHRMPAAILLIGLMCMPLAGCSGTLIDTVLADLPIATDIATSIVAIVSPGDAAYLQEVTEYAGKVSGDLKLIESLVQQYKSNLAAAPGGTTGQIHAALGDAQSNLAAILKTVGVSNPKITSAVAAAVASVNLILNDVSLLVKNSTPQAVSAQLFSGVGMPVDMTTEDERLRDKKLSADVPKASGKSARQIAKEYNQKISRDFPAAKVNVPRLRVLSIPMPMTGGR